MSQSKSNDESFGGFVANLRPDVLKAFVLFIMAKIFGFSGVILGFSPDLRVAGGGLLALAFVCIWTSLFYCMKDLSKNKPPDEYNGREW